MAAPKWKYLAFILLLSFQQFTAHRTPPKAPLADNPTHYILERPAPPSSADLAHTVPPLGDDDPPTPPPSPSVDHTHNVSDGIVPLGGGGGGLPSIGVGSERGEGWGSGHGNGGGTGSGGGWGGGGGSGGNIPSYGTPPFIPGMPPPFGDPFHCTPMSCLAGNTKACEQGFSLHFYPPMLDGKNHGSNGKDGMAPESG